MEIQDQRKRGENVEQNRWEGGNGTDDINSRILQYRNRQFSNIGTMRHENWVAGNQPGHIMEYRESSWKEICLWYTLSGICYCWSCKLELKNNVSAPPRGSSCSFFIRRWNTLESGAFGFCGSQGHQVLPVTSLAL